MGVAQEVKIYKENLISDKKGFIKILLKHIGVFVLGFLYSFSGFGKSFSPFGIAFSCSMQKAFLLTATMGSVTGYFFALDSVTALRYTAAIFAMVVVISATKSFYWLRDNPLTSVAVVFVCLFVTGLASAVAEGLSITNLLLCFSEGAIGGISTYAFARCRSILSIKGGLTCITSKEATSIVVCITVLLLAINGVSIYGVSPARIIASFFILLCGYYGREAGGSIVGVCAGVTMLLSGGDVYILAFYALGGLLSGVFSQFGRFSSFFAYCFSGIAVVVVSYKSAHIFPLVIETVIAGLVFFAVTQKFKKQLESIFLPAVTSPVIDSVRADIVTKLKRASEYSAEICNSVNSVNNALAKNNPTDSSYIISSVRNKVCGSCGLYDSCWGEVEKTTKQCFETLLNLKKDGVYLEYKTAPQGFASLCIRTENICSAFNKLYGEYAINQRMEGKIREIHTSAAEQFVNISSLLGSLSDNVGKSVRFDMDIAARTRAAASSCGLTPVESCCYYNNTDKLVIELKIKKPYEKNMLSNLNKQIELLAGRGLDLPEKEEADDELKLIFKEKSDYVVVNSVVQYNAYEEKFSGDSYTTFEDYDGYFYALICDGMGTGTKAAISSSLAVNLFEKLIKAGFGIIPSIKTVNSSLISKTGDECSVTLDLVCIDLYTGHCEFYKCGASDTLVKKHNKVMNIGFSTLPLGILNNCDIKSGSGQLEAGDVIIMCSDGVREEDYYPLRKELKGFNGGSVRNFTTEVCEYIRRSQPPKNDDMTVITLALTKNEDR